MTETAGPLAPAEPYVLAAAASGLIDMIESEGGDVDRIFGRARVDTSRLDSPLSELGLKQYCRLFEEAARQTQYDNFGLRFGNGFRPRQLGALGYLAIDSPTMAAALRNLAVYFPAHQQSTPLSIRSAPVLRAGPVSARPLPARRAEPFARRKPWRPVRSAARAAGSADNATSRRTKA